MGQVRIDRGRRAGAFALVVLAAALTLAGSGEFPAGAAVTAVKGGAEGYRLQVSLFGGPVNTRGVGQVTCTSENPPTPPGCVPAAQAEEASSPSVVLPADGGRLNGSKPEGAAARSGPATFFSSGQLDVATQGGIGPDGSVTSATSILNINREGSESFTAVAASSTCSASETGVSASTTITDGTLMIDTGDDGTGIAHDPVVVPVPTKPDPNTTYDGHIHVNGTTESWRYVFNEQVVNLDGSITVYAAHQYLLGPTAVGDLYIGKADCGVTGDGTVTTTTTSPGVPTTLPTVSTTLPVPTTLPPTPTTTVPDQYLTQICNPAPIVQPNDFTFVDGRSTPYPSPIVVSGLTGTVTDVEMSLLDFTTSGGEANTWPNDMDILAAAPDNSNVILMSDAGGDNNYSTGSVVAVDITFDDEAAEQLPANGRITTGTWRPVDDDGDPPDDAGNPDTWPPPAPPPMDTTLLSTFDGMDPNGVWNLFANDDQVLGTTQILGGWCLNITTTTSTGPTTTTTTTTGPTTTTTVPSGPVLTLNGPATATVGCRTPPTVTAELLVDGLAEPNAIVTFTVAGPARAVPPGGTATTGSDGKASFTFSAGQAGDYTVTAAVTHEGVEKTASHTVRFNEPQLSVTVDGPATGQTEETTTVTATVDDGCGPLPGAVVDFAATWPAQDKPWTGQATPSSGTATTDADGKARFSFTADRAGDYAVTASTSLAGQQASATHTVQTDVLAFKRVASIPLGSGDLYIAATLMDPAGRYVYVVAETQSRTLRKIDLATSQVVGDIHLGNIPVAAVIDPAGRHAYVVVEDELKKIDLATLQVVGTIPMETDTSRVAPTLIDPAGNFLYVGSPVARVEAPDGTTSTAAGVVKVNLNTFQRVGAIHLGDDEAPLVGAMDPAGGFAYVATERRLVKLNLATFSQEGSIPSELDDGQPMSALIDPAGDHAYIGTRGKVVKIDLRSATRVAALTLGPEQPNSQSDLRSAVMDPKGAFAYFGKYCCGGPEGSDLTRVPTPNRLVKIDLRTFEPVHALALEDNQLVEAVSDPAGNYAYIASESVEFDYTTGGFVPGDLVKVQLRRPSNPALAADNDAYATDYETPLAVPVPGVLEGDTDADGDPLVAGQTSDPAHGSVTLNADGSFAYTPDAYFVGTDTFTYTASDGMDYSAPATVSVTVRPPQGLTGSAFGYSADVSLFGGAAERRGFGQPSTAPATAASPSVSLPADASPTTAHDPDGATGQYGPAVIFGGIWPDDVAAGPPSGPLTATTQGSTAGGWVTSSAKVELHPTPVPVRCDGDPAGTTNCTVPGGVGPGPLIAHEAHSTCTANKSGVSASASFVNGVVETKYDPHTQEPIAFHPLPNPLPAGYTVEGTLDHVGDRFRIVFNEQLRTSDGSLVYVNAAHMYLLGPIAVGDMVIARSVCGAPPGPNTAPDAVDDAYTTAAGTPLTVGAPGVLANDADVDADPLTAGSASDPAGGSVALSPDGSFTYTPDAGFVGTDTFTYTAADGHDGSDSATVTMTVTPPPDLRPTQLSVSDLSVVEGDGATAAFTVTRSGNTAGASTVKYRTSGGTASAGTDYTAVTTLTTLSFGAGETTKTVTVDVTGDTLPEANETFNLVLSAPTGAVLADASGAATIRNDDGAAYLAVDSLTVSEANADTAATFRITRSGNTVGTSTVKYKTANGTAGAEDFTAVALASVTFGSGETSKDVTVTIKGDAVDEKNETFALTLSTPVGATVTDTAGTATIVDDEGTVVPGPATFLSVDNLLVNEGNTGPAPAVFTVTRTGDTAGASTVKYRTSGGNATAGADYTAVPSTTLSFAAGETTKTVSVDVLGDGLPEGDETFNLTLSAPAGAVLADAAGTATIVNDDGAAYLGVDNVAVTEGDTGTRTVTFTVSRSGNITGASTVKLKTSGGTAVAGTDYTAVALTEVAFAPGESTKTVTVDVAGDTTSEPNETFNLLLSAPVGATVSDTSGTVTIINDD